MAQGTHEIKAGLAQMLKGGIIMDVVNAEQARIAESAGACAVMALEKIPADIRKDGGVARMSDPKMIKEIMAAVSIPVMAKVRIGHFAEAQILQHIGVDFIDESEVLTPADAERHIDKAKFKIPFVCGARDLGEALRRISEGAVMIRTKGEAGTGNVVEAVRHATTISREIKEAAKLDQNGRLALAEQLRVDVDLLNKTIDLGRLPVVNFAAGGLGVDGVFVGSGIFKSSIPEKRARAMVLATTHWNDPAVLAEVSEDLGEAMVGIQMDEHLQRWASRESQPQTKTQ